MFDRVSVGGEDALGGFDAAAFVSGVASDCLGYAESLPAANKQRESVLVEARDILPRVRDHATQAQLYIDLARIELAGKDLVDGLAAMQKANSLVVTFAPSPERDGMRAALLRLVLRLDSIDVATKFGWSIGIDDPKLSRNALRAIAMAEIASRRVGKQVLLLAASKDAQKRSSDLAAYVAGQVNGGSAYRALVAALAIDDGNLVLRDAALNGIFAMQLAKRNRPEAIIAPFALSGDGARQAALSRLASYAVERGRLAVARDTIRHIDDPLERWRALTTVATRLSSDGLAVDWAKTWDMAIAAGSGIEPGQRVEAIRVLGVQAADMGDVDRAESALAQAEGSNAAQEIARRIVLAQIGSGKLDLAIARFDALEEHPAKGQVAASIYSALIARGDMERAARFAAAIVAPSDRITRLIADADGRGTASTDPDASASLVPLGQAQDALASIIDPVLRDSAAIAVARANARRGRIEGVDAALAMASADTRMAMSPLRAGAVARSGGAQAAFLLLDAMPPDRRDRGLAEIADALSAGKNPIAAFDAARQIGDDHLRRAALRRNAELQARDQRFRSADGAFPVTPQPDGAESQFTIATDRFLLKAVAPGAAKNAPDVIAGAKVTGRDIRAMVPATEPGNVRIVPTGFSNFDEKFSYIRYLNNVDLNGGEEEILAQGQGTLFPQFILIEKGVYDLPLLKAQLESATTSEPTITNDGRVYQLNVPLLIGQDATLVLSSADVEELRLNTAAHAYIVNSGRVFITDVKLTSWDPATGTPTPRSKKAWSEFSPFYTAWSGSETYIADSVINGLGYGNGKSYGISISNGPINVLKATLNAVARPKGIIVDSTFTDMYYAFYSYEAEDFKLIGNEYRDNEIYGIDPHDRSKHLTIAYNTVSGTREKHGIITSREVKDSVIMGNVSADNNGSGFMLDRSSDNNAVAYNLAFRNGADGMTVYESSCNLLFRNHFVDNGRDGVKLRNSWDLLVSDNLIDGNEGFGINLYASSIEDTPEAAHRDFAMDPYTRYANLTAVRNMISGNKKSALRSVQTSALVLSGNRLAMDSKKLFQQSDFSTLGSAVMSIAGKGAGLRDTCQPVRPQTPCPYLSDGYFGKDLVAELEMSAPSIQCSNAVN